MLGMPAHRDRQCSSCQLKAGKVRPMGHRCIKDDEFAGHKVKTSGGVEI